MKWKVSVLGTLLALSLNGLPAWAQKFPVKPVRIAVSTNAGGLQDQRARAVAQGLNALWNEGVVIDNKPGVAAIVAADTVLRAPADGHAILATDNITLLTNVVLRADKTPYDIEKDFAPLVGLVSSSNMIVASPKLPANNLPELIALARAKPGVLNYGSYGVGSVSHINMEALISHYGLKATHIPYTGGPSLGAALMSDAVHFGFNGMTSSISLIRSGRLKAIAFGGLKRSLLFPNVPTIAESIPGFQSTTWFAWYIRAETPQAVIQKIIADVGSVISNPAFVEKFVTPVGNELMNAQGARLSEIFAADKKVFAVWVKTLNLEL